VPGGPLRQVDGLVHLQAAAGERAEAVQETLLQQGSRQVVLNLGDVSYVDSAGLGVIVSASLAARKAGGVVRLLNPSKRLQQLLEMAKLFTILDVCQSEAQAFGGATSES
jgi:anti-sigma B factor antagonist